MHIDPEHFNPQNYNSTGLKKLDFIIGAVGGFISFWYTFGKSVQATVTTTYHKIDNVPIPEVHIDNKQMYVHGGFSVLLAFVSMVLCTIGASVIREVLKKHPDAKITKIRDWMVKLLASKNNG